MHFCRRESLLFFSLLSIELSWGQINQPHISGETSRYNPDSSYFVYQQPQHPRDCQEVYTQCSGTNSSGIYVIKPDGYSAPFEVYCDNERDGGFWIVFYRRTEGFLHFNRNWEEQRNGFGFLRNEFWLGLEKLSFLTNQKNYEIRINIENAAGSFFFIHYNDFRITDQFSDFRIASLGHYTGTAESFTVLCPTNMEYGNCTCQATCDEPGNTTECQTSCNDEETCICREGFLKKEDHCVPPTECGCYVQGKGVIPNGENHLNIDCTSLCRCQSNNLTCNNTECSSYATCEERDGVRQCYCKDGYTGNGQNCEVIATDCADIYNAGDTDSGVYTIKPRNWPASPFEVFCNMTDGGGWTVFQRRVNGSEDFYRGWVSYKDGFGSPDHELWLGNEKIFYLTNQRSNQLRIDLVDRDGSPYYAKYNLFRISDEATKYTLIGLGTYTGNAGFDALHRDRNSSFSTFDLDNDDWNDINCSERQRGAWWYWQGQILPWGDCATLIHYCDLWPFGSNSCGYCTDANLNGDYYTLTRGTNVYWNNLPGYDCSVQYTEMKIKPID